MPYLFCISIQQQKETNWFISTVPFQLLMEAISITLTPRNIMIITVLTSLHAKNWSTAISTDSYIMATIWSSILISLHLQSAFSQENCVALWSKDAVA